MVGRSHLRRVLYPREMRCQWKWCCEEATVHLFRPVDGVRYEYEPLPPGSRRRFPKKHRIWHENLFVCENCQPAAQKEYRYLSYVHPDRFQEECRPAR